MGAKGYQAAFHPSTGVAHLLSISLRKTLCGLRVSEAWESIDQATCGQCSAIVAKRIPVAVPEPPASESGEHTNDVELEQP